MISVVPKNPNNDEHYSGYGVKYIYHNNTKQEGWFEDGLLNGYGRIYSNYDFESQGNQK